MAHAPGSGNTHSRKTITKDLIIETDYEGEVMAVVATQSMFGIRLWGAVDYVVLNHVMTSDNEVVLRINPTPTPDDIPPVVVRRMSKEEKRQRALRVMVEAKRGLR
jgi:hypothetical protein